jgi:hypothetical protein
MVVPHAHDSPHASEPVSPVVLTYAKPLCQHVRLAPDPVRSAYRSREAGKEMHEHP